MSKHCSSKSYLVLRLERYSVPRLNNSDLNSVFPSICSFKPYSSYIIDSWYKDLWKFLSNSVIQITEDLPDPPTLRRDDTFLMPIFVRAGYRGKQLRVLNEVRLFLRALTIADIASADGTWVQHFAYYLTRPSLLRSNYDWSTPIPVNAPERALWK